MIGNSVWMIGLVAAALAPGAGVEGWEVTHRAREAAPGEVVLVKVTSPAPLAWLEGTIFNRKFPFYSTTDPMSWEGLIGIDLETEAGIYTLQLSGLSLAEFPVESEYVLRVLPRVFPVRHITVEERYVNPPSGEQERIEREHRRVSGILECVTPQRYWSGRFARPVPGEASSSFGKKSIINGQPRSPHTGTDFRAASGTPVLAPNAGIVALADNLYFSGNTVIIDHGLGLYSYFAHLSEFSLREGDPVTRGETVGKVGATGRVTGPHLHWTLRLVNTRVDPLSLLEILQDDTD